VQISLFLYIVGKVIGFDLGNIPDELLLYVFLGNGRKAPFLLLISRKLKVKIV